MKDISTCWFWNTSTNSKDSWVCGSEKKREWQYNALTKHRKQTEAQLAAKKAKGGTMANFLAAAGTPGMSKEEVEFRRAALEAERGPAPKSEPDAQYGQC